MSDPDVKRQVLQKQFSILKVHQTCFFFFPFEASNLFLPILQGKPGKDVHDQEIWTSKMSGFVCSNKKSKKNSRKGRRDSPYELLLFFVNSLLWY